MNEVARINAELESALKKNDGKKTLELLELLVNMPITVMVLHETHIGVTVNKIRKSLEHPEAVALSKKVVKKYKKVLESYKQQTNDGTKASQTNKETTSGNGNTTSSSSNSNGATPTNNANTTSNNTSENCGSGDPATGSVAQTEHSNPMDQKHQAPSTGAGREDPGSSGALKREAPASRPSFIAREVPQTSAPARIKFRQMITDALKQPLPKELQTSEPFLDEESLAARMEETIFQEFKSDTDPKYRNRIRSRIINLKDNKNNPYLRLNVLRGDISAERLAKMSADDMASDELKRQREQFTREAINDHQMALTGGTSSTEIKCPACKKYDCSYNQMQTRSADEPMTTFCHCNNCGKRWKFC